MVAGAGTQGGPEAGRERVDARYVCQGEGCTQTVEEWLWVKSRRWFCSQGCAEKAPYRVPTVVDLAPSNL